MRRARKPVLLPVSFLALSCAALLLAVVLAGACSALSSLNVPAMDASGKGIMTSTRARLVSGSNGVFLDTKPFSSVETQQSAETAAKLAARKAGADLERNAVLYSVNADAEVIDGPSGGVAFALLAYAELAGKTLRSDLAATGAIEQDGSVGKVGGVTQKLDAVRDARLRVFLVPLGQSVQQGIDLAQLGEQYGVSVVEIASFDEAVAIAFTPVGSEVKAPKREKKPLALAAIEAPPESLFMKSLAESEARRLQSLEAELSKKTDNASRRVAEALRESLNSSRELLAKNYFYSAANAAFVARVAADAFAAANYSKQEFAEVVRALAGEANASFQQKFGDAAPVLSESNWEIVVGAQARYAWARAKASELGEEAPAAASVLPFVEDYASARAWLEASESLLNAIPADSSSGKSFNEFNARGESKALIERANSSLAASYDADGEWHLSVAQDSFSAGDYAAAAFDACFALGFSRARAKAEGVFGDDFAALFGNASALAGFKSVWAQLYYAHSLYSLAEANRTGDFAFSLNALKLQELASCFEESSGGLEEAMSSTLPLASPSPEAEGLNATLEVVYSTNEQGVLGYQQKLLFLAAFAALVILVVVFAFFIRARLREREPLLTDEERERKLDDALLKGRIGEATYERLRAKYSRKGVKRGSSSSSVFQASTRRTRPPRRRAR